MRAAVVAACAAVAAVTYVSIRWVNATVPDPYMDEPFHAGQTVTYLRGRWTEWDPKITTLPGLYVASVIMCRAMPWIDCEQVTSLRMLNVFWVTALFLCLYHLLSLLNTTSSRAVLKALEIMTHPVLAFHSLLFYTDVPSLTMVLLTWIAVRHDRMVAGGIAGLAAVCFRQTNIIWVAWAALQVIVATYHAQASQAAKKWLLPHFILWALRNVQQLFKVLFPIIAVGIVFAAFVVANGSIVVGDRTNHVAVVHLPQLLYFCAFACVFMWRLPRHLPNLPLIAALAPLAILAVHYKTYAHPFILSDNRHYTFYAWKNFFQRYSWFRYAVIPVYLLAVDMIVRIIGTSRPFLWQAFYWICTAACLVPSPLIDTRYFIVPFVVIQLEETQLSIRAISWRILANCSVHLVVLCVFLLRPFTWADGSTARFMW
ncbi:Dol-P-Glc:Glc(2)Man(9)GlcNAc(2)-PP-Dol alpha-1,2-glucosyltransferase [Plasmodiophora brassicae]|uniref:Dol-P-Glc:Glc(2)Man(9)GlcNAc(2)-PP-Dol alpha-1,2-glucosyltransferase n=1 Tax=Plasmodiophora brassicae TaxID=37360 RepID=A0A0G4IJV3_PLABS|nr:hypothetical protein PBRA_004209 [Plasmodiophora brassicae]